MNNLRTVTIKMTRGQALRLCLLINNHAFSLKMEKSETTNSEVEEWLSIRDKVRAGVDKLDEKEF